MCSVCVVRLSGWVVVVFVVLIVGWCFSVRRFDCVV